MNIKTRKYFIIFVALSGVVINLVYGIELLHEFYSSSEDTIKEILISAIVLEFAWGLLLIWMILNPFKRKDIMLLSIVPILMGNILHNINLVLFQQGNIMDGIVNFLFGFLYAVLYLFAYKVGKVDLEKKF